MANFFPAVPDHGLHSLDPQNAKGFTARLANYEDNLKLRPPCDKERGSNWTVEDQRSRFLCILPPYV